MVAPKTRGEIGEKALFLSLFPPLPGRLRSFLALRPRRGRDITRRARPARAFLRPGGVPSSRRPGKAMTDPARNDRPRRALPWGFLGMVGLLLALESYVGRH